MAGESAGYCGMKAHIVTSLKLLAVIAVVWCGSMLVDSYRHIEAEQRATAARNKGTEAIMRIRQIVRQYPEGDMPSDALAQIEREYAIHAEAEAVGQSVR
jgi:hypothetical protein